jgi:hypothetical protein
MFEARTTINFLGPAGNFYHFYIPGPRGRDRLGLDGNTVLKKYFTSSRIPNRS